MSSTSYGRCKKIKQICSSRHGAVETNLTRKHEVTGLIPGLTQQVKDLVSRGLWCRPAAVALIQPLAWEPPYAAGAALKNKKEEKLSKSASLSLGFS